MQTKHDLERWYEQQDPWSYKENPDDLYRKDRILSALPTNKFRTALDVGGGEGWITKDLPARWKYIYELSDEACSRIPDSVRRLSYEQLKACDLVIATGVFYKQYDWEEMHNITLKYAKKTILTSHIKSWEIPLHSTDIEQIHVEEFPYREYTQILRVFRVI